MKKNYIMLFFFLCFLNIINLCDAISKNKSNRKTRINAISNEFRKRNHKKNLSKRKLDGTGDGTSNYRYVPLKIFIDTAELNRTCGDLGFKDTIIKAMYKAKGILEEFIQLYIYPEGTIDIINTLGGITYNLIKDTCEIEEYDQMFDENIQKIDNNYFIFGKCVESLDDKEFKEESDSIIIDFTDGVPDMGLILFNKRDNFINNMDKSLENLTNLMLHHFIRLLGFNSALLDEDFFNTNYLPYDNVNEVYYLQTIGSYNFNNVINYAKKYFNCPNIERINLYFDENLDSDESHYSYTIFDIVGLYWPKEIFAGELLTKYDYSEKKVLSGFTLAFLDDLPYLKVTKDYKSEIIRFGQNIGYKCKCEYLYDLDYRDGFYYTDTCMEGFFMAMKESSESETHCQSDGNKDYYFLYNSESNIYKKCELEIPNCRKCSSKTKCTSCKNGYKLEDEDGKTICEEDNGLSTGAIIGIVFGCVGFLVIVALIIICILKRRNKENEEEIKENEEVPEKKDVDTVPQNVKDGQEDNIKVLDLSKKNEVMDSNVKIMNPDDK